VISLTYGQAKAEIARVCGSSGMSVTDPRVKVRTNEATQELMLEGLWAGIVDRWHVRANDGHIVLPPYLEMLLEFTASGVPQQIMAPYAEFVSYGPGVQDDLLGRSGSRHWCRCGTGDLFDRGESPTVTDIPISSGSSCVCTDGTSAVTDGPWVLRQYADMTRDEAADIYSTIQGLDDSGFLVRSSITTGSAVEWTDGVRLGITSGSSFTETTQTFSKITAYTKPVTNGYVRLTAWNGTTEVELANYEPRETQPSYHRYYSPFLQSRRNSDPCCKVVLARARRRFVPITEDNNVLIISNLPALKAMLISQWKRDAGDYEAYSVLKLTAVDLMKKESSAYRPKTKTPALTFQRGFSLGELPAIR
jgi:hypothetical protein